MRREYIDGTPVRELYPDRAADASGGFGPPYFTYDERLRDNTLGEIERRLGCVEEDPQFELRLQEVGYE